MIDWVFGRPLGLIFLILFGDRLTSGLLLFRTLSSQVPSTHIKDRNPPAPHVFATGADQDFNVLVESR